MLDEIDTYIGELWIKEIALPKVGGSHIISWSPAQIISLTSPRQEELCQQKAFSLEPQHHHFSGSSAWWATLRIWNLPVSVIIWANSLHNPSLLLPLSIFYIFVEIKIYLLLLLLSFLPYLVTLCRMYLWRFSLEDLASYLTTEVWLPPDVCPVLLTWASAALQGIQWCSRLSWYKTDHLQIGRLC